MNLLKTFSVLALSAGILSCNNKASTNKDHGDTTGATTAARTDTAGQIKEEAVSVTADTATLNSYVAYNAAEQGRRPIVLVIPEWWGLNDYARMRARKLAELGYLAMAVDVYGGGRTGSTPEQAQSLAMPFYESPQLAKSRIDAALAKAKTLPQADTSQTAIIGYCFGGTMALKAAYLGSDFDGVVVFHGGLEALPPPRKDKLKARILLAQGGADEFVPKSRTAAVLKSLDSIGAHYTYKSYPNATHAFTNPQATETGKQFKMPIRYNGAADTASWNDMKTFFGSVFTPNP